MFCWGRKRAGQGLVVEKAARNATFVCVCRLFQYAWAASRFHCGSSGVCIEGCKTATSVAYGIASSVLVHRGNDVHGGLLLLFERTSRSRESLRTAQLERCRVWLNWVVVTSDGCGVCSEALGPAFQQFYRSSQGRHLARPRLFVFSQTFWFGGQPYDLRPNPKSEKKGEVMGKNICGVRFRPLRFAYAITLNILRHGYSHRRRSALMVIRC